MDDQSYNIRVPKRWARVAMIVGATTLIVAPLTAVAGHVFNDVPNNNTFHDDIAWLADADVTKGCNPPANTDFCPKDDVTREQMAAFMRRLAENRVVDAASIQGLTGDEIASVSGTRGAPSGQLAVPYQTETTIEEITISAPTDGFLFIQSNASYRFGSVTLIQWLQVDETECQAVEGISDSVDFSYASLAPDADRQTASNGAVVPVDRGNHTITLCVTTSAGAGNTVLDGTHLSAIFFASGEALEPLHQ